MPKTLITCIAIWALLCAGNLFSGTPQDPPADQHYDLQLLVRGGWGGFAENNTSAASNQTNGPAGEAEGDDLIKGLSMDSTGNMYWASSPYPVISQYDKNRNWVSTIAGSVSVYMDGPLESARFNGWSYNNTNLICVSDDGKHLFVVDNINNRWRYIDLDSGMVSTIGAFNTAGVYLMIAKDCGSGDIYAFKSNGGAAPDCKGYKKLTSAPWKTELQGFDGIALDATAMKFYSHARKSSIAVNLLTGDTTILTPDMWCPTGMSISAGGRYLYIGGGDDSFCWRKDLVNGDLLRLGHNTGGIDGKDIWFRTGGEGYSWPIQTSCNWPSACVFSTDGASGAWPTCWGIFFMIPRN